MKFNSKLELGGKTATGIEVPAEVIRDLESGKRPAVAVTIRGYTYRSTVGSMDGKYMLPVSAEVRERAGIAAGDEVEVQIELDTAPREVAVPPDFQAALDLDPDARRFFDALSYSNKRRLVMQIDGAKTADTRQKRITKTVDMLREGRV